MARTRQKPTSASTSSSSSSSRAIFQRGSSNFLTRLWTHLASSSPFSSSIQWSKNGSTIVISNSKIFAEKILLSLYGHSNFDTFQRQMSIYGFSRSSPGTPAGTTPTTVYHLYRHPTFTRSTPLSEVIDCSRHANSNSKEAREGRKKTSSAAAAIARSAKGWATDGTRASPYSAWAGRRPDVEKELASTEPLEGGKKKAGGSKKKAVSLVEVTVADDVESDLEDPAPSRLPAPARGRPFTRSSSTTASKRPTRSRSIHRPPPSLFQRPDSEFSDAEADQTSASASATSPPVVVKSRAERMLEREAKKNEALVAASLARERLEREREVAREEEVEEVEMETGVVAEMAVEDKEEPEEGKVVGDDEVTGTEQRVDEPSHRLAASTGLPAALSRKKSAPRWKPLKLTEHEGHQLHIDDDIDASPLPFQEQPAEVLLPAINLIPSTQSSSPRSLSLRSSAPNLRSASTFLTSLTFLAFSSPPPSHPALSSDVDLFAAVDSFPDSSTTTGTGLRPLPITIPRSQSLGFDQHRPAPSSSSPVSSTFSTLSLRSSTAPPTPALPLRSRPRSISSTSDQAEHMLRHQRQVSVHPYAHSPAAAEARLSFSSSSSSKAPPIALPKSRRRASTSTISSPNSTETTGSLVSPFTPFPFSLLNVQSVSPIAPARINAKAITISHLTRELVSTSLSTDPYALRVLGSPPQPSFLRTPLFEEEKEEDDLAMEFGEDGEECAALKRMSAGSCESEESFGNQPGEGGISGLGVELDEVDEEAYYQRARFPSTTFSSSSYSTFSSEDTFSPPLQPSDPPHSHPYAAAARPSSHHPQHPSAHQSPYSVSQHPLSSFESGDSASHPTFSPSSSYSPHMIILPPPRPNRPHHFPEHNAPPLSQSFSSSSASDSFPHPHNDGHYPPQTYPSHPSTPLSSPAAAAASAAAAYCYTPIVERRSSHAEQGNAADGHAHHTYIRRYQSVGVLGDLYGRSGPGSRREKWW